nr:MAG TPA: hypothetical protein [Caudoviricetes sp.]
MKKSSFCVANYKELYKHIRICYYIICGYSLTYGVGV